MSEHYKCYVMDAADCASACGKYAYRAIFYFPAIFNLALHAFVCFHISQMK